MLIKDVFNTKIARLRASTDMKTAAELFCVTQVSDLMVVDDQDRFVGVVSEGDLIRAVMPDFEEVSSAGGSLEDAYRLFLETGHELADQRVERIIISNPITVAPEDPLLKAATIMIAKHIRLLPVVERDRLLGTVSRADICWGLLTAAR